jgi:hypothetical protein
MTAEQQGHTPKLTKPQLELLRQSEGFGALCSDHYQPAKKLIELGLVTSHSGAFGSHRVTITESGRAALAKATGGQS